MARPLAGRTILVTRPAGQQEGLVRRLELLGARALHIPTIRIEPPADPAPLLSAVSRLGSYDWIVLTSVNGVERLRGALDDSGRSPSTLAASRIAAIGPATADALAGLGARPEVVPESYRAEALVAAILRAAARPGVDRPLCGRRVLVVRAAEARPVLARRLREQGALVDVVPAYETHVERAGVDRLTRLIAGRELDWLTFTAPSTVRAHVELVGRRTGGARVAAIGPITARAIRAASLRVDTTAREYTAAGLAVAIVRAESGSGRHARPRSADR